MTLPIPLRPTRAAPLLALLALAACAPSPDGGAQLPGFLRPAGAEAEEPPAPEPLPAAVQAALPPGVPSSVVLQDAAGCYLYSIERTDPPSGYPLRDASGNPLCEGALPPVTTADGAPIDIAPVLSAPAPGAVPATGTGIAVPDGVGPVTSPDDAFAPVVPVADPGTGAFAPGSITPPAPLAPLN